MKDIIQQFFTGYIVPLIGAVFTIVVLPKLNQILKAHHLSLLQGLVDKDAEKIVMAETNKMAFAVGGEADKIKWPQVVTNAMSGLLAKHQGLSTVEAGNIVHAIMLKTPGIGPMDIGDTNGQRNTGIVGNLPSETGSTGLPRGQAGGGGSGSGGTAGGQGGGAGGGERGGDQGEGTGGPDPLSKSLVRTLLIGALGMAMLGLAACIPIFQH